MITNTIFGDSLLKLSCNGPPNPILIMKAPKIEPYYRSLKGPFKEPFKGTPPKKPSLLIKASIIRGFRGLVQNPGVPHHRVTPQP